MKTTIFDCIKNDAQLLNAKISMCVGGSAPHTHNNIKCGVVGISLHNSNCDNNCNSIKEK